MLHRYYVEWSAPNYRDAGNTHVMAGTKPGAITRAKEKLGSKVRQKHLHHFNAWRDTAAQGYGPTPRRRQWPHV